MPTLLLRCVAPLQAWDTQSNFNVRTTGREPTKSGIIGLLCAALGRPRRAPVEDLAALRMGVRADQEGVLLRDWHTAGKGGYLKAGGSIERKNLITSTRYYLSDAAFLVGLEGSDRALLERLHHALRHPRWMLYLGRKSCPPSLPVYLPDGLRDEDLRTALRTYPWIGQLEKRYLSLEEQNPRGLRVVIEDENGVIVQNDHPISFERFQRRFAPRRVRVEWVPWVPFRAQEVA